MLAKAVGDQVPDAPGLLYEPKWDGFRCLAFRDGDQVNLQSKAAKGLSRYFPELVGALAALKEQYPRILCEGGPHLFTSLLQHGLVDELAWSISPHIGGSGSLLTTPATAGAIPKHAHSHPEGVFTLWGIQ